MGRKITEVIVLFSSHPIKGTYYQSDDADLNYLAEIVLVFSNVKTEWGVISHLLEGGAFT